MRTNQHAAGKVGKGVLIKPGLLVDPVEPRQKL